MKKFISVCLLAFYVVISVISPGISQSAGLVEVKFVNNSVYHQICIMVESLHDFDEKYSFILYPRWMAKKVDKLQKSKTKAFGSFSLFLEPKEYFFSFVKIYDNGWDAMVIPGANNVYWDLQVFKDFPNPMFVRTFTYGWYKI